LRPGLNSEIKAEQTQTDSVTAKIEKIKANGLVEVKFSKLMNTGLIKIDEINEAHMIIYAQPFNNWHEQDPHFDIEKTLNQTWNVLKYENDRMLIDLTFMNPNQISPKVDQDILVIHFQNSSDAFKSEDNLGLHQDYLSMQHGIPK